MQIITVRLGPGDHSRACFPFSALMCARVGMHMFARNVVSYASAKKGLFVILIMGLRGELASQPVPVQWGIRKKTGIHKLEFGKVVSLL